MARRCLGKMVAGVGLLVIIVTWSEALSLQERDDANEQATYHLNMLKRSVDEMKKTLTTSVTSKVVKRSTKQPADGLILNSLDSYCNHFKSDPDINKYLKESAALRPLSTRDISGSTPFKSNKNSRDNMEPDVFPTRVLAERENDKVWLIFQIAHSDSAIISRIDPYNFKENFLQMPEDSCKTVVSKARFEIDASSHTKCKKNYEGLEKRKQIVEAAFQMTSQKDSHYRFTAYVDVCKFDFKYDQWNDRWMTMEEIHSETAHSPTFRLTPDTGDSRSIEKDVDLNVDLNVNISLTAQLYIRLVLWDWTQNKTVQSSANVKSNNLNQVTIQYERTKYNLEEIFTVEIKNVTKCVKNRNIFCTSLTIFLNTASGNRSGKLFLNYIEKYTDTYRYSYPILSRAGVERTIQIKLPDEPRDVPDDLIYFNPKQRFMCNEDGDRQSEEEVVIGNKKGYNPFGKNCTIKCQAFGRDISSIYITSLKPIKSPVRLSSHILPESAVAILDVGPSSDSIDGGYRCTAVDIRGQTRTQDLKLYTHLFTEVKSLELETPDTETAIVTCTIYGESGLDLSIVVSENNNNETRLDDRYERNITTNEEENITNLTLLVPWEELRLPRNLLRCYARAERGDHSKKLELSYYVQNRVGIVPSIANGAFDAFDVNARNATATLNCTATGLQPIHLSIDYDMWSYSDKISLHDNPHVIKSTTTTDNNVTVTYQNVPVRRYDFKCMATNEYGSASARLSYYHINWGF